MNPNSSAQRRIPDNPISRRRSGRTRAPAPATVRPDRGNRLVQSVLEWYAEQARKLPWREAGNSVQHEASVSQVSSDQIFYMQQRGLSEAQAMSLSVNGFVNDLVRQFPMEYSVELKRLIELEMEGSVG
jgi:hypothetical protein